jgi:hypothetical protein
MAREFRNVQAQIDIYGSLIVQRLGDQLDANNTNASGSLKGSIELTVKPESKGFIIDALQYWEAVNSGRKAGKQPPMGEIMKWLSYPNVRDKIRFGASDKAFGEREQKSLAYLIARKIGREGTKGTNFFTNVYNSDVIDDMVSAIADGALLDYTAILDEIIENYNRNR